MFLMAFNFMTNVDPETQRLLSNLQSVLMPILYAVGCAGLIFSTVKFSIAIIHDPKNKGIYIKHMIWCFIGCILLFIVSGAVHIFLNHMQGLS